MTNELIIMKSLQRFLWVTDFSYCQHYTVITLKLKDHYDIYRIFGFTAGKFCSKHLGC